MIDQDQERLDEYWTEKFEREVTPEQRQAFALAAKRRKPPVAQGPALRAFAIRGALRELRAEVAAKGAESVLDTYRKAKDNAR